MLWRPEVWWVTLGSDVECWWLVALAGWIFRSHTTNTLQVMLPGWSGWVAVAGAVDGTGNRSGNASVDVSSGMGWSLPLVSVPPTVIPLAASCTQLPPSPGGHARGRARSHPGHSESCLGLLICTFISDNEFYNHTFMFSLTLLSPLYLVCLLLLHLCCPYKSYLNYVWD